MSELRRVAVTGIGAVTTCGVGLEALWEGLNKTAPLGEKRVADWDPDPYFENKKLARRADRVTQFAFAAAEEAIEMSNGINADLTRSGVIFATGVGGMITFETNVETLLTKGERRVSPFMIPMMMPNAAGAGLSMRYGLQGACETIVTACAAGTHAIGNAARMIRMGMLDLVISGGTEAVMSPTGMAAFRNMTALSSSGVSRPFDKRRDGFMMTEGSAVLVLEEYSAAEARGATILGEIMGSGSTADAHHITAPLPGGVGAMACMKLAVNDAGLDTSDIAYVNAHGTATPLNDAAEAAAISKVFPHNPPVTSIKGVTGHGLGAAGAIEAVSIIQSIEKSLIPPTIGYAEVDPELPEINLVSGKAREWTPGPTISNSFGFGGHNGTLIIGPPR